jgi:hypothetical protein
MEKSILLKKSCKKIAHLNDIFNTHLLQHIIVTNDNQNAMYLRGAHNKLKRPKVAQISF